MNLTSGYIQQQHRSRSNGARGATTRVAPSAVRGGYGGQSAPHALQPVREVRPQAIAPATAVDQTAFVLFMIVTGVLFTRPAEIVPALVGLPLYEVLIIPCFLLALPAILRQLSPRNLAARPIILFVIGIGAAAVLSYAAKLQPYGVKFTFLKYAKLLVYFALFVTLINTKQRLRQFVMWMTLFLGVLTVVALLHYHHAVNIPVLDAYEEKETNAETGEITIIRRFRSTGFFQDPNDMGQILAVGMILCLYWITDKPTRELRLLWVALLVMFGYAFSQTHSRGQMLSILIAIPLVFEAIKGWRKMIPWTALVIPLVLVVFAGRATQISLDEDTGQERIQLWSDALSFLKYRPVFGIGEDGFQEETGLVAHNSYLHKYAETGLIGGTIFLGAVWLAITSLRQLVKQRAAIVDPELQRIGPYLLGAVGAWAAGMLSLSRHDIVPTYIMLGLAAAFAAMARTNPPVPAMRFNAKLVRQVTFISFVFVVGAYLFVKVMVRWAD